MRRTLCTLLLLVMLLQWSAPALAVGTSAASAILIDADTGRVLYEQNADEPRLIASITKIMTALTALEHCATDKIYTVQSGDMAEGSSMYLKAGERVTLEELLYGLMLSSGNDAALAVARCVSGSVERFVALMNQKAKEIGMEHTSFANPNGLDHEDHYSTARDMAALTRRAMENETFCRIVSTKSITIGERTLVNHNKLLSWYDGCVGVKTGFTKAAGRTLVSAARREGQLLIAVTLHDGNDWQDHQNLLDYGFSAFPRTLVLPAGQQMGSTQVKGSFLLTVPVRTGTALYCPLTAGEEPEITCHYYEAVTAPIAAGTAVGEAVATLNGQELGRVPLIIAQDVGLHMIRKS